MRTQYTSVAAAWTRWLNPQVWTQAHQTHAPKKTSSRWDLHPLVMVLLLMTWTTGDSEGERFATARAFYVAGHQHGKRPGQTLQGFQLALARLPLPVRHALFAAIRSYLRDAFRRCWRSHGLVVMAGDGSRLACPRSAQLEKRLGRCGKNDSAPMLFVTARVLWPAGWLWSWVVGPGTASEHDHVRQLLATLPRHTLWRWGVAGVFRTYKRTLPKIKLWSRTEALAYREAEVSRLGLQLLLAQTAAKRRPEGVMVIVVGSPRQELLRIRGTITTTLGVKLGPRPRRWYEQQLAEVRAGGGGRKVRRKWPRRKDHPAPKPPKILVMSKTLKAKLVKRLNAEKGGNR